MSSHLASFHSSSEQRSVLAILDLFAPGQEYYIGLMKRWDCEYNALNKAGDKAQRNYFSVSFEWTDKSTVDYQSWAMYQPSAGNDPFTRPCTISNARGMWRDEDCAIKSYFLCAKPRSKQLELATSECIH